MSDYIVRYYITNIVRKVLKYNSSEDLSRLNLLNSLDFEVEMEEEDSINLGLDKIYFSLSKKEYESILSFYIDGYYIKDLILYGSIEILENFTGLSLFALNKPIDNLFIVSR